VLALFNLDMGRRIEALESALSDGRAITATYHPAYKHEQSEQPDRVVMEIEGTGRKLVFGMEMAASVAEQLRVNGRSDVADVIKSAKA
jgi:hypothetical protein